MCIFIRILYMYMCILFSLNIFCITRHIKLYIEFLQNYKSNAGFFFFFNQDNPKKLKKKRELWLPQVITPFIY